MKKKYSIHWFRQDLRLNDNPSISHLIKKNDPIIFIFILDEGYNMPNLGSASKVWLYHSLSYLNKQLNGKLCLFKDSALNTFKKILNKFSISSISWNRCYEPEAINRDTSIKKFLKSKIIDVKSFNGSLLWEPWDNLKVDGTPYKVFTPFFKNGCLHNISPRKPKSTPKILSSKIYSIKSEPLINLDLLPNKKWSSSITNGWKIGESHAKDLMLNFFKNGLNNYKEGRNFPSKLNVSKLSPYIRWGQISPNTLWYNVEKFSDKASIQNIDIFKSELGWREFSYYLLYHFPHVTEKNLQKKFDNFSWEFDKVKLKNWSKGFTGFPIVDAGMRELWKTGYMHNRVRMIVGSFLVKNLLHHWKYGERWFWDCLFDADAASNSASWQWVAGTGADAAPYFRIFNPVSQSQKFDPDGIYIRKFVPELKNLPSKYLFTPWECPSEICKNLNFQLGRDYPNPIIDLKLSREKALHNFSLLKK